MSQRTRTRDMMPSTVALKVAMALSGAGLVAFAAQHMFGHLIVFQGRSAYNEYAHFMQSLGSIKWAARFGLLGLVGLHIMSGLALSKRNQDARPEGYVQLKSLRTTFSAKSMMLAGGFLFFFLVYHILHFTVGWVDAGEYGLVDPAGLKDVYTHFVASFQDLRILGTYLAAATFLAMHLSHGVTSMFKTLGLARGRYRAPVEALGPVVAIFLWLGYIAPPLACFMHILSEV